MRSLVVQGGVFSGLGRRVSSLFFKSQQSEPQEAKRVIVDENREIAFVLTSTNLQRWKISRVNDEVSLPEILHLFFIVFLQFQSDVGLIPLLKGLMNIAGWVDPAVDPSISIIDMQICVGNVVLLFAVSEESVSHYGIGMMYLNLCCATYCTKIMLRSFKPLLSLLQEHCRASACTFIWQLHNDIHT